MRSPRIFGKSGSSSCKTTMPRITASLCSKPITSLRTVLRSSGRKSDGSFFTSDRIRRMTSPARASSSTMSWRMSRTSSRSGLGALRNRFAAWALLRIAASGWLISCASAAAISPIVAIRPAWASSSLICRASCSACLRSVTSTTRAKYPRTTPRSSWSGT